jgi:hypothetical protein
VKPIKTEPDATDSGHSVLAALNRLYIQCVVRADAEAFEKLLADDFLCSNADGTIVDKSEFLGRVRSSPPLQFMDIDDVQIRLIGSVAVIHARTTFASSEGITGRGRYTDVWTNRDGRWLAVAAHVTRLPA